jgi:hypothetical protein
METFFRGFILDGCQFLADGIFTRKPEDRLICAATSSCFVLLVPPPPGNSPYEENWTSSILHANTHGDTPQIATLRAFKTLS